MPTSTARSVRSSSQSIRSSAKVRVLGSPRTRRFGRRDPFDGKTSRHARQCEFVGVSDPAVLRVLLKVKDGAGGDYWWVECGACDTAWQVPYYAESVK
jgi:hypothetical protein